MFLSVKPQVRACPPYGSKQSKIAIVGDIASPFDMQSLKPFSGPAGTVLESCLHAAGLISADVYMTNVIKVKSTQKVRQDNKDDNEFFDGKKGTFKPMGMEWLHSFREEMETVDANVIVALGRPAFAACAGLHSLSKYRGYFFPSKDMPKECKVIPSHHPSQSIRGMYTYRHLLVHDLSKAKAEWDSPKLVRPERQLIWEYANVEEALGWLDYFLGQDLLGFDIEVINYEVSCISFSSKPDLAIVIPIADRWREEEELLIWRKISQLLGNPNSTKVVQNGMFDIHFLLMKQGIVVRGPLHDTMIAHSVMYPEFPKGLGFLGSLYCGTSQYWKDTVKFTNIKDES